MSHDGFQRRKVSDRQLSVRLELPERSSLNSDRVFNLTGSVHNFND